MTTGEITSAALNILRREQARGVTFGSFEESTPEGLWYADERRYDDDLRRRIDRIQWELERDFSRRLTHEVIFGPDVPYESPVDPVDDWQTPESFYNCELRWF